MSYHILWHRQLDICNCFNPNIFTLIAAPLLSFGTSDKSFNIHFNHCCHNIYIHTLRIFCDAIKRLLFLIREIITGFMSLLQLCVPISGHDDLTTNRVFTFSVFNEIEQDWVAICLQQKEVFGIDVIAFFEDCKHIQKRNGKFSFWYTKEDVHFLQVQLRRHSLVGFRHVLYVFCYFGFL